MTLLARPKPGPRAGAAWAFCTLNRSASVKPSIAEPPMRSRSRRVTPSQVSLPACPGITSIANLQYGTVFGLNDREGNCSDTRGRTEGKTGRVYQSSGAESGHAGERDVPSRNIWLRYIVTLHIRPVNEEVRRIVGNPSRPFKTALYPVRAIPPRGAFWTLRFRFRTLRYILNL